MPPTPIHFAARSDLTKAVAAWRQWLAAERRSSVHTLDGYGRDLAAFLGFLTEHHREAATQNIIQIVLLHIFIEQQRTGLGLNTLGQL